MFNQILEQVTARFGLSQDTAKQLLGMLVAQIFNPKRGGPAGFLQSLRDQGLGDTVASWLGHGPNEPISAAQLEGVLGSETINHMSTKLGVPATTVSGAAAAILPDAINELSEHGDLPTSAAGIPGKFGSWFGNLQDHLDDLGHWGAAAAGAGAAALGASVGTVGDAPLRVTDTAGTHASRADATATDSVREAGSGGIGKWLPWLLLIAAAIAALFFFRGCQRNEATAPVAPVATQTPAATTPAAQFDSRLVLARNGDKLTYDGVVDGEATKASIIEALNQAYGAGNVSGNISVDANARPPGWLAALGGFLPQFTANGAALTFEGNNVNLDGSIADADKAGLLDKLKAAFGGFSFGGMFEGLGAAAAGAAANVEDAAADALAKLTPGQFSADDLVKALNLMIIHFETGSANISAISDDILGKAAAAIRQVPAGTRIEVGGHTDNIGNAAANQRLSQQRADAVKTRLAELGVSADMLATKGYGQDKPVADNGSADGRAKNRRIEFAVQK